jgi:hypothetical protein
LVAELPASFKLKKKKGDDGRTRLVGKDDLGGEYIAKTLNGPEITEQDLHDLRAADRESYSSREAGARAFTKSLVDHKASREAAFLNDPNDDWVEAAMPVVRAGFGITPSVGSTRRYSEAFEHVKW